MTKPSEKTILFEEIEFKIPSDAAELPVEAIEAFEDEKIVIFVRILMGPDAWAEFKKRKPTMADFGRLGDAIGSQYGFGNVGESSASVDSSEITSVPSRPTSHASTEWTSPQSASAP